MCESFSKLLTNIQQLFDQHSQKVFHFLRNNLQLFRIVALLFTKYLPTVCPLPAHHSFDYLPSSPGQNTPYILAATPKYKYRQRNTTVFPPVSAFIAALTTIPQIGSLFVQHLSTI